MPARRKQARLPRCGDTVRVLETGELAQVVGVIATADRGSEWRVRLRSAGRQVRAHGSDTLPVSAVAFV